MANVSSRTGFKAHNSDNLRLASMVLAASFTGKDGDELYLGSGGYPTMTRNSAYPIIGAQAGVIMDKDDLTTIATSEDGDFVMMTDPRQDHVAEIATGARNDPFTTFTASAAFDIAGASGAQYILQSSSTYDQIQVLGPAREVSGSNAGRISEYGANQKVVCRFNQAKVMPVYSNYEQKK